MTRHLAKPRKRKKLGFSRHTVIGHVEGGETGIGVTKHGIDGVVPVDTAPPATRLPHPVQHSAYLERIVTVAHCN